LSVVRNECHCRKCGGLNVGNADSAVDRRVILTLILFQVEVNNLSTVSNILTNVVESVRLNTGGERSHLREFFSGVPDDTLNETLTSADGEEVDLKSRGLKSHWVSCVDGLIIGHPGTPRRGAVPLYQLSPQSTHNCVLWGNLLAQRIIGWVNLKPNIITVCLDCLPCSSATTHKRI